MKYPGGISDCPYCRWLDNWNNFHVASPIHDEKTGKWAVLCGECYRYGPDEGSPRYAIKAWNKLYEDGVDTSMPIRKMGGIA